MANIIKCPHCGRSFEITEALRREIEGKTAKKIEEEVRKEIAEKSSLEISDLKKQLQEKSDKIEEFRDNELKLREERRK
jgi:hypothetical protein